MMNKLTKNMGDIRFWIILFFVVRLYGITNLPLEIGHHWKQTTVTMPARNFLETVPSILYPRIDIAGEKTGITGMEFPLLNYLIYAQSLLFGYTHWYGRLINLLASSFGLYFFYILVSKYVEPGLAFNATMILLFSMGFSYSRKIMPDTFSMSLMLTGMYYGSNYLDRAHRWKDLLLYFIFVLAGLLSKLPAAYIGALFVFLIADRSVPALIRVYFSMVSAILLGIVSVYYFYRVPYLVKTYGFSRFFMGESIGQGAREIIGHMNETLKKFYAGARKYAGFICFAAGLVMAFLKKEKAVLAVFVTGLLSFVLLVVLKSGFAFYHHIYYIIPFVPVMALVAAYGIQQIKDRRIAVAVVALIGLEGVGNQFSDFRNKKNYAAILNLERDLDLISGRKDLVLINSGDFPTPMYFAHRKGWVNSNEKIGSPGYIGVLKNKGLKFIIILKKAFGENMVIKQQQVFSNDEYDIYKL